MSETRLVSFATPDFYRRQQLLSDSSVGLKVVDRALQFKHVDILQSSYGREYRALLEHSRGAGYWAWKPYLILKVLEEVAEGDWVLYSDVGRWARILSHRLDPLLEWCSSHQQPFLPGTRIRDLGSADLWTKRHCAERFGFDEERLKSFQQVGATWSLWSKCEESIRFLEEWKALSHEPGLIDDSPSPGGEGPGFIEHRHDQSVLSCLIERDGVKAMFDEGGPEGANHRNCKDLDWVLAQLGAERSGSTSERRKFQQRQRRQNIVIWFRNQARRCKHLLKGTKVGVKK